MAILGRERTLLHLTFGHASAAEALAALRSAPAGDALVPDIADEDWNADLVNRLQAYAAGGADDFLDVPLDLANLRPFQRNVVVHCRHIPLGQTRTYGELAALAGSPGAARAVGNVMAANQTPLVVPCHRVVAAGDRIGQYSAAGGRRMKLRLLETEARRAEG
jgi:methylated-DNA-[protein]-cysteine S-methyltransferase